MESELVINLWALYDSTFGCVYGVMGKVYNLSGTDSEKLAILKQLATTDYITEKRMKLSPRFKVFNGERELEGLAAPSTVNDPNSGVFSELFVTLQDNLPPLPDFSGNGSNEIKQRIPDPPLTVTTFLYEDTDGNIRPITTAEDREWLQEQELLNRKLWYG